MELGRTADDRAAQFWLRKRVLLTGGAGFVGAAVREALLGRGVPSESIVVPRSRGLDLRVSANCRRAVKGCDIVIHLAAITGGIAFARAHPASQYRDCSLINLNMLDAAREAGVAKFVALGNLLAYPASAPSPLMEASLHDGAVADTHLGVGLAKRDLVALAEMYHREYGLDAVCVLGANAYGPGDRFDPVHAHVIPATIMKCLRDEDLVVWGDGTPTRDFLYVDDLAEGILLAAERLDAPGFVNVASGTEVSIAELVRTIAGICGFRGRIVFDPSKGTGDPRRVASVEAASRRIGFSPRVALAEGLRRTVDWYRSQARARA
jgi:GDP-L-fucose synthase